MAPKDKPYRVYRGGRVKGKVPDGARRKTRPSTANGRGRECAPGTRSHLALAAALVEAGRPDRHCSTVLLLAIAWGVIGFLSFSERRVGREQALRPRARREGALATSNGFLLSHGTTILLLGTDTSTVGRPERRPPRRLDHPSPHRPVAPPALLPLDPPRPARARARVGNAKINASYQAGGAALAIKTVHDFTGVPIDHAVIVDFNGFKDLIDAEGGITINVPEPILSNRFDCPYPDAGARCLQWKGWRFARGPQHMNGAAGADLLADPREPAQPGRERPHARRAAAGCRAGGRGEAGLGRHARSALPFDGNKLMKPLATDLSTWQLIELGWVKFRASGSHVLYCRLGGDATTVGGSSVLLPSEDNRSVLAMWAGLRHPSRRRRPSGPGCRVGHPLQ